MVLQRTSGDCRLKFARLQAARCSQSSTAFRRPYRANGRFADWPLAIKSILGFWFVYALTVAARALMGTDPMTILLNKLFVISHRHRPHRARLRRPRERSRQGSVRKKAIVAALASFAAAWGMAGSFIAIEDMMREPKEEFRYQSREGFVIIEKGHTLTVERRAQEPLVLTWPRVGNSMPTSASATPPTRRSSGCSSSSPGAPFTSRPSRRPKRWNAKRRAVEAEGAAQAAQVRALRYQINPHFLFNTLNSLSSLVMADRPDEAENMILKLSTFFRSSLSLDPSADVTLAEEIELQRLYLDIEKVRFPRRLKVEIDIPNELVSAASPPSSSSLWSRTPSSSACPGRATRYAPHPRRRGRPRPLHDRGSEQRRHRRTSRNGKPDGTGVGLTNVCQRIDARFGSAAKCEFGPTADGGYRVLMTLPLDRADG